MYAITILNDVVDQLTDHFEKCESVNYLYRECKKIVEEKIVEMKEYDFGSLLTWLDEMKLRCYKGKYKCIKRIVYSFNDCINHNAVSSKTRFVYKNDNSQFKKASKASQQIIFDYVSKAYRCSSDFLPYLRNYISYYFLFLERNNLNYESIAYHDIFKFKDYIRSLKLSSQSTKRIFNNSAKFINDTSADLRTKIGSLILKTTHDEYIEKISAIQHDVLASFDLTTRPAIDYARVQLFFEELREKNIPLKAASKQRG